LDLLKFDLVDIINSQEFRLFRQRNRNPQLVEGCKGCPLIDQCKGGCAAHAYLHHAVQTGEKSFKKKDPYCPVDYWEKEGHTYPKDDGKAREQILVHMDYLCTWIGTPKRK
jgi:radical SAM protein with 4Fe4S-binding SPASM domain